jgi:membrane-bound serine protease (ClpP class)
MRQHLPWSGLLLVLFALPPQSAGAQTAPVYRLEVHGTIENGLAPYLARGIRMANAAGAAAIILDLDTPGGRIDAAERIADAVRASAVPVYAFVNPRAYSAGALIALATKAIYMTDGAVLGAATPVDGEGTKLAEKYVSAMRGEFRALAEAHGLDPRIAEAMVDEKIGAPGLAEPGQLVTLSTSEAVRVGYAKGVVQSEAALLATLGLSGAPVTLIDPNWAELVVRFLTNPIVSSLLLSLGVLGLLTEIKAGAHGLGLLVSLVALGLFFGSSLLLGLAGMGTLLLLGIGVLLLGVEMFVIPGHGVTGIVGSALIAGSMIMAMLGPSPTGTDLMRALAVLAGSVVITGAVTYAFVRHLPNSGRFSGLIHQESSGAAAGFIAAPARDELVGQEGVAVTDLRPAGVASVANERLDVVTEGEYIAIGSKVRVVRAEGYRHVVRAAG